MLKNITSSSHGVRNVIHFRLSNLTSYLVPDFLPVVERCSETSTVESSIGVDKM